MNTRPKSPSSVARPFGHSLFFCLALWAGLRCQPALGQDQTVNGNLTVIDNTYLDQGLEVGGSVNIDGAELSVNELDASSIGTGGNVTLNGYLTIGIDYNLVNSVVETSSGGIFTDLITYNDVEERADWLWQQNYDEMGDTVTQMELNPNGVLTVSDPSSDYITLDPGNSSIVVDGQAIALISTNATAIALGASAATGDINTVAIGPGAYAAEHGAYALGTSASALGYDSVALGSSATTNAQDSVAIGPGAVSGNHGAYTLGAFASAQGADSVALGSSASTSANDSLALGVLASASGTDSVALGSSTTANAENSVAIGSGAETENARAYAIGNLSSALGYDSVALGTNAVTNAENSVAIGPGAVSGSHGSYTLGAFANAQNPDSVALGSSASTAADDSLALGVLAYTSGIDSVALGYSASTGADDSLALGLSATTLDVNTVALGTSATAQGTDSVAIGYSASTVSYDSVALGTNAVTNAENSVAIGPGAVSGSHGSYTLGAFANAQNPDSVALGSSASTAADDSLALGVLASTSGTDSVALGYSASVDGTDAISIGSYANNTWNGSVVIGTGANATVPAGATGWSPAFVVADGNLSSPPHSNSLTILHNGNAGFGNAARNPLEQVEIAGRLLLDANSTSNITANGTLRWTGTDLLVSKNGAWTNITTVSSGAGVITTGPVITVNLTSTGNTTIFLPAGTQIGDVENVLVEASNISNLTVAPSMRFLAGATSQSVVANVTLTGLANSTVFKLEPSQPASIISSSAGLTLNVTTAATATNATVTIYPVLNLHN
jgi:autotransporter adhesin